MRSAANTLHSKAMCQRAGECPQEALSWHTGLGLTSQGFLATSSSSTSTLSLSAKILSQDLLLLTEPSWYTGDVYIPAQGLSTTPLPLLCPHHTHLPVLASISQLRQDLLVYASLLRTHFRTFLNVLTFPHAMIVCYHTPPARTSLCMSSRDLSLSSNLNWAWGTQPSFPDRKENVPLLSWG